MDRIRVARGPPGTMVAAGWPMQVGQMAPAGSYEGDHVRRGGVRRVRIAVAVVVRRASSWLGVVQHRSAGADLHAASGTRVGPQEFLSDSAATASAIRRFADALGGMARRSDRPRPRRLHRGSIGVRTDSARTAASLDPAGRRSSARCAAPGGRRTARRGRRARCPRSTGGACRATPPRSVSHLAPLRTAIAALKQAGAG